MDGTGNKKTPRTLAAQPAAAAQAGCLGAISGSAEGGVPQGPQVPGAAADPSPRKGRLTRMLLAARQMQQR
ncbi:MAG TPA: hypothetical protein VHL79_15910 [Ramlibacter sp.]|jgi:hypothetical protein|nr:hypothetical protein [Ramlibacter sp.]